MSKNLKENEPYVIEALCQLINEQSELAIVYAKRFDETGCAIYHKKSRVHIHIANTLKKEIIKLKEVSKVLE